MMTQPDIRHPALLMTGPREVTLEMVSIPNPEPGEVRVAVSCSCISPGTEMRCFERTQEGLPAGPFIPGYSAAGVIESVGPGVELSPGTPVFLTGTSRADFPTAWGGHTSMAVTRASSVLPVPPHTDLVALSIAKLAAIARRGVRLARPEPGEVVAVVGLGPIGQLSARLFSLEGCRVLGVDPDPGRCALLESAGVAAVDPSRDVAAELRTRFGATAAIVVDATGAPPVFAAALQASSPLEWSDNAGAGPRIVVQGSYKDSLLVPYNEVFVREATLLFPRDQRHEDLVDAVGAIASGRLAARNLISRTIRPQDAQPTYEALAGRVNGLLTAAFIWHAAS